MTDLERVLYFVIDRKNDCKRLEDISCFSDKFKMQLTGMKEAYDSIANYINFLLNLEPEKTDDKGLEDKVQKVFTKGSQEYIDLSKTSNYNLSYANIRNCEDCSFCRESMLQGKIYIGYCPCTWCPNLQVTSSNNTQGNEFYSKENKDE